MTQGPGPVPPFAAMLRASVLPLAAATPVIVAAFWITRAARGGLAALLGVTVALAFFAGGLYVMSRVTNANPISVLVGAITVYLGQVIFLGVVIVSLSSAVWLDGKAFGLSVLAVALTWQLVQIVAFLRLRKPVYDDPFASPATGLTEPTVKQTAKPIDERADEPVQRRLG